jgi:hypothetical protein
MHAVGRGRAGTPRVRYGSEAVVPRQNLKVDFPESGRSQFQLAGLESARSGSSGRPAVGSHL